MNKLLWALFLSFFFSKEGNSDSKEYNKFRDLLKKTYAHHCQGCRVEKKAEWARRREEGLGGWSNTSHSVLSPQGGALGTLLGATLTLGFLPGLANLNLYFVRVDQKDHIGDALQGGQLPIIRGLQVEPLQHPGHEEEECLAGHVLPYAGAGSCSEGQVA